MSDTGQCHAGRSYPRRYDVTITVNRDGDSPSDSAEFSAYVLSLLGYGTIIMNSNSAV